MPLTTRGDGSMVTLADLGFVDGVIYESIVSTYNSDGTANAAPMGVTLQDTQSLRLTAFNTSQTYRNLKANRYGVVNLTGNVEMFYRTAFKETNPDGKLPKEWFTKAETVQAPKLRFADAAVEVSASVMEALGAEKTRVLCRVQHVSAQKKYPQAFSRARAATLEAIVHATRVKVFMHDAGKQEQVAQLLALIANCRDVVNHTAPHSQYCAVMTDLMRLIHSWRSKP